MINSMQKVIIEKDLRFVKDSRGNLSSIIIVSLIFSVVFPAIFIVSMHLNPDGMGDLEHLFGMFYETMDQTEANIAVLSLVLNNIVPVFFLIIPIIATTTMATSSFIGEKEKRTLETLLYSPLSVSQIFSSKVLASFLLSMFVTVTTFIAYFIVSQGLLYFLFGHFMLPGVNWYLTIFVVAPALSLLAVTVTCKISAKAQTVEEAFQKAGLLAIPIVIIAASQFTGLMMLNAGILLAAAAVVGIIAFVLMKSALKSFTYEMLLK